MERGRIEAGRQRGNFYRIRISANFYGTGPMKVDLQVLSRAKTPRVHRESMRHDLYTPSRNDIWDVIRHEPKREKET